MSKPNPVKFQLPKSTLNLAGLAAALAAIFIYFSVQAPQFHTLDNVELLLRQSTIVAVVAFGMTYVIISGGIDLSIGSVAAFSGVVIATLMQKGWATLPSCLVGIAAGSVCGLINGLLITRLKVGPFIVTLGSLLIARGAAKGLAHEQKVNAPETWLGDILAKLGHNETWKIFPVGVWMTILLAVLMTLILRYTRFGRHVVAVGSNEAAAKLCGVPNDTVKMKVYALSGLFAGIAGMLYVSRLSVGDPTIAEGLELDAIAAVVIGGASLTGGEGGIVGSILGALIMATLRGGASQLGYPNWIQQIVTGSIIILAVFLDRVRKR